MNCLSLNIQGLGSKAKKDWIRELTTKHKVSFLSLQETKKESFSDLEVKYFWGNYQFDHIVSEALGYSGGILCVWDSNVFHKQHHIIFDNFVALYGTWIPSKIQLLIIPVYAPQSYASKFQLWDFIASLINQWNGECMVMGDFNEVRCKEDRWGSTFLAQGACSFNSFISNAGLNEVQLEGSSFTWAHPSASKMSKLDCFLVTDGFLSLFPHISAVCLDRHLSDHRPSVTLGRCYVDFGASLISVYTILALYSVSIKMIPSTWNFFYSCDKARMIRFKKKLQLLKKEIQRANLSVKGIMIEGEWVDDPIRVKDEFRNHFADRFNDPGTRHGRINFSFPNRLTFEQVSDLETSVSDEEIRKAVWGCGENKSPGGCLRIDDALTISHLFYADDAIFIGDWSKENLKGLLAKWVWRFLSQDNSLWCQLISAIHGSSITDLSTAYPSTWNSIIKEFNYLKVQGVDVFSHCKIRIGNGLHTRFWKDLWIGDCTLSGLFPRLFALDTVKDISVACKLQSPLVALLDFVILSNSNDRWVSDLNGDGVFRVKDVGSLLDEFFLPMADVSTRWVKNIPIKVNIFA
ncbi:RNA-directed DNA polymerase, eukaryota [Tanacetum coccineum]